jgi:ribonuclease E
VTTEPPRAVPEAWPVTRGRQENPVTLDNEQTGADAGAPALATTTAPEPALEPETQTKTPARRRRAASRPAGPPAADAVPPEAGGSTTPDLAVVSTAPEPVGEDTAPTRTVRKRAARKKASPAEGDETAAPRRRRARKTAASAPVEPASPVEPAESGPEVTEPTGTRRARAPRAAKPVTENATATAPGVEQGETGTPEDAAGAPGTAEHARAASAPLIAMPLFQAPDPSAAVSRRRRVASRPAGPPRVDGTGEAADTLSSESDAEPVEEPLDDLETDPGSDSAEDDLSDDLGEPGRRRRRRRGGRGRRGRARGEDDVDGDTEDDDLAEEETDDSEDAGPEEEGQETGAGSRRRRRRRRRSGAGDAEPAPDDPPNTVVKVRDGRRGGSDDVTALKGSTRLEAKKQRRREGREAGRRRPVITEAQFLARRESVDRTMVVRERDGRTQIGVLEDNVLVEHYVARRTQTSMVGNVYLGRVQNVLPSMEAAFVDIGKGRNAVLYAGEVNWDAAGLEGQPKRIEHALKSGESVLVQVTKDPIGHKGARLTSQVSLPGRYLVYVPDGSMTGISRKLPDTERARLKKALRQIVPDDAGVIVRTAAEGASRDELERDVSRLQAHWEDISRKAQAVNAPALLYGEPDLAIRVVRDIFNEDFARLVISGDDVWDTLQGYIAHVAPDLVERLERWDGDGDVFAAFRIDEQLAKALDRKVWLPSGGSLVIDRTEAMTVVDVNTGKFTGAGGNLEETVTKNNIEAAEEIVRQLRLRDIGGIIVVDFIDMVLESNRDLVLRRLLECLGRDRTKHQVAEVTSLGLVQMTRKRVGSGLLEVFSETCEHCGGRGLILHDEPVEKRQQSDGGGRGRAGQASAGSSTSGKASPSAAEGRTATEDTPGNGRGRHRRGRGGAPSEDFGGSGDEAMPTLAAGS